MLLTQLVETSNRVAATASRLAKIQLLAECLREMEPGEIEVGTSYLSGSLPGGSIGVGWASLDQQWRPATTPSLAVSDLSRRLDQVGATTGQGSQESRRQQLAALFEAATQSEQQFLWGLLAGGVRQGALEGVMVEAVANAFDLPARTVRRALMLSGGIGAVTAVARAGGQVAVEAIDLTLMRPVKPMLAGSAPDLEAALERLPEAAIEWKLDGVRIQVHRRGSEVAIFTRNLLDATPRVPEIAGAVRSLDGDEFILDGEAIVLAGDGAPVPFEETMSKFGTEELPERNLIPFFFDILMIEGRSVLEAAGAERRRLLADLVPAGMLIPRIETLFLREADDFARAALEAGHEGVMVKSVQAPYEAGRRGLSWIKVKPAHSLDLVVLAAEWGHGRRTGWLSNIHLGARGPDGFVMLGKTFKGMTDEMLEWQTKKFLDLETQRSRHVVYLQPELVVEIAADGVQSSPRYPGGVALRFARVKRYRPDKSAAEADTIETVRDLYRG